MNLLLDQRINSNPRPFSCFSNATLLDSQMANTRRCRRVLILDHAVALTRQYQRQHRLLIGSNQGPRRRRLWSRQAVLENSKYILICKITSSGSDAQYNCGQLVVPVNNN